MKRIVSVSLGSKSGDFVRQTVIGGVPLTLSREGTDGDWLAARNRIEALDGSIDAIGLGGIDVYLSVGSELLVIGDGMRLKEAASITPVVDGSGLKNTLERHVVGDLAAKGLITPSSHILMVSALDRFGMAEAFVDLGCSCVFGDLIFNIGLDYPLTKLSEIEEIARKYRRRLLTVPFHMLYPTGSAQDEKKADNRYAKYYESADVIAGDSHLILRHLPAIIDGKGIVTNTTRQKTIDRFRSAGASWVITTTPNFDGISSGTNLMEAAIVAISGKSHLSAEEYRSWVRTLAWNGSFTDLRQRKDSAKS